MSWNFMDAASRENIDRVWRQEAAEALELVSDPSIWEAPTAAGHWQVRDVVAHLVHNTEGYLRAFAAPRGEADTTEPIDLHDMASMMNDGALSLRTVERAELLDRLRADLERLLKAVADLGDDEWAGLMLPHDYLGPSPACFYPICQVLDYAVHAWDIRQGLGTAHALDGDAADLLVPACFLLWSNTNDTTGVEPFSIGIRVTAGRNAGDTRASVTSEGLKFTTTGLDDVDDVIEFDPAGLVLTANGRINGGTYRGNRQVLDRFRNLFFSV
ncbi:maleylpyruvate isomerase N-terminal domain-containing protein [Saccharopolyspora erythraea]|uniref:maleylpyruvate isomerase family mycothiol-dependent enzyme n=1 Tax=Saccharopolyspora erythraea TaxID=1836 RepID=UPI001BA5F952|nr:maleylpyruvate isomerase family mycothiol-dependent enzyme [Saccharopolyspora erythraea]QUH01858.1 maleylpyruvate isomerase N-terminal domain-containing protein [Saccharopolyspora erythraea]